MLDFFPVTSQLASAQMKRRLSVPNLSSGNNLLMFRLNAPALMMTGAFSPNVSKLFSKLKLHGNR